MSSSRPSAGGQRSAKFLTLLLLALTTSTTLALAARSTVHVGGGSGSLSQHNPQQILGARQETVKQGCKECDICNGFCHLYRDQKNGAQRYEICMNKCFTQCNDQVCKALEASRKEWEAYDQSERKRIEEENLAIAKKEKETRERLEEERKKYEEKEKERLKKEEEERKEREKKVMEKIEADKKERERKEADKKADEEKKRAEKKKELETKSMETFKTWMKESLLNLEVGQVARIPKGGSTVKVRRGSGPRAAKQKMVEKRNEEDERKRREEEERKKKEEEERKKKEEDEKKKKEEDERKKKEEDEKKKKEEDEKKKKEEEEKKKAEELRKKFSDAIYNPKNTNTGIINIPFLNPFHQLSQHKIPEFRDPAKNPSLTDEAKRILKEYNAGRQERIKKLKAEFEKQKKTTLELGKDKSDAAKKELVEALSKDQALDMKKFSEVEKTLKDEAMKRAFGSDKWEQMKKDRKAKFDRFKNDNKDKWESFKKSAGTHLTWDKLKNGTLSTWETFKNGAKHATDTTRSKWYDIKTTGAPKVDQIRIDMADKLREKEFKAKWEQLKKEAGGKWDDLDLDMDWDKFSLDKDWEGKWDKVKQALKTTKESLPDVKIQIEPPVTRGNSKRGRVSEKLARRKRLVTGEVTEY